MAAGCHEGGHGVGDGASPGAGYGPAHGALVYWLSSSACSLVQVTPSVVASTCAIVLTSCPGLLVQRIRMSFNLYGPCASVHI